MRPSPSVLAVSPTRSLAGHRGVLRRVTASRVEDTTHRSRARWLAGSLGAASAGRLRRVEGGRDGEARRAPGRRRARVDGDRLARPRRREGRRAGARDQEPGRARGKRSMAARTRPGRSRRRRASTSRLRSERPEVAHGFFGWPASRASRPRSRRRPTSFVVVGDAWRASPSPGRGPTTAVAGPRAPPARGSRWRSRHTRRPAPRRRGGQARRGGRGASALRTAPRSRGRELLAPRGFGGSHRQGWVPIEDLSRSRPG